ncbi:MAG: hypothetical protein WB511_05160 [Nitrososphaeraceae archaeon]
MPEIQGHIISIAKAPDGDIYIGGENIYKLISIDRNRITPSTFFIDAVTKDVQITDLSLNLSSKVLSIDFKNNNNNNNNSDGNIETAFPPSLLVKVPKALLGGIFQVTSEKYNETSTSEQNGIIEEFSTKETLKVSNVGDTIIDIKLKSNVGSDRVLIKGQTSTLVPAPSRNTIIR